MLERTMMFTKCHNYLNKRLLTYLLKVQTIIKTNVRYYITIQAQCYIKHKWPTKLFELVYVNGKNSK